MIRNKKSGTKRKNSGKQSKGGEEMKFQGTEEPHRPENKLAELTRSRNSMATEATMERKDEIRG